MKKFNPIFLILISMLLAACGSVDPTEQGDSSDLATEIVSANQHHGTTDQSPEKVAPTQNSGATDEMASPKQDKGATEMLPSNGAQLPAGMVSLNYSRLSLNYAKLSWSASYVKSAFLKVSINYSQNYIEIPLTGKNQSGSIKVHLPAKKNTFTMFYRDWANRQNKKEIKVARGS